jgi:hypothetical protein
LCRGDSSFPQVADEQVSEGQAMRLGVVDEQAVAALLLEPLLDVDGLLRTVGVQALERPADFADPDGVGVLGARNLGLEALGF